MAFPCILWKDWFQRGGRVLRSERSERSRTRRPAGRSSFPGSGKDRAGSWIAGRPPVVVARTVVGAVFNEEQARIRKEG